MKIRGAFKNNPRGHINLGISLGPIEGGYQKSWFGRLLIFNICSYIPYILHVISHIFYTIYLYVGSVLLSMCRFEALHGHRYSGAPGSARTRLEWPQGRKTEVNMRAIVNTSKGILYH